MATLANVQKHSPNEESSHNAWRTNCCNDLTFVVNCFDNSIGAGKIRVLNEIKDSVLLTLTNDVDTVGVSARNLELWQVSPHTSFKKSLLGFKRQQST